ncbi:MAG: hypothetical protein BIFFINMI_03578 [Phycisphaerae bacterium]|nr:hypothetical protein [Phycisphaerae bacterium]
MSENITSVSSDNVDLETLDLTGTPDGQSQPQVFILKGQANIDPLAGGQTQTINEYTALSIPALYRGVNFITYAVAGLPKYILQREEGAPKRLYKHPLDWVLNHEPNGLQTPITFLTTYFLHYLIWSAAYAGIDRTGRQVQLFNLPPDRMHPFRFQGRQWFALDLEKPQDANRPNSRYLIFGDDEILYMPALSFDGMRPLGLIRLMTGSLRTAKQTEKYVGEFYEHGGIFGGFLSSEKPMTKEQITDITDKIRNEYSGAGKAHKWMVVSSLKPTPLTAQLDTQQVVENRQFAIGDVARMLGLPAYVLGDMTKATWANIEQLSMEVVKYSLAFRIMPFEQECSRKLLTRAERQAGVYVHVDTAKLLTGDHASQAETSNKRLLNGITCIDEERAILGLPPLPNGLGSVPHVPANTVPLAPQPAPEPADQDDEQLSAKPSAPLEQARPTLDDFADLLGAAAEQVETKTRKATEGHRGKDDFVVWGNVFAEQQRGYVRQVLAPIHATLTRLGLTLPEPEVIGQRYADALRRWFAGIVREENAAPPSVIHLIKG